MKKWVMAIAMAAMAALNVQAATHAKVQLWEKGPYWATTNIGANAPEEYGLYFWWGDTVGHAATSHYSFCEENTPTCNKSIDALQREGWITASGILTPEHDAAQVQWGNSWRMPTLQELIDLCYNKCDWTWTMLNGVNGYIVQGRGDYASARIFLPAAGGGFGSSIDWGGSRGYYWASDVDSDCLDWSAWTIDFSSCDIVIYYDYCRWGGHSIRPVNDFAGETFSIIFDANGGAGTMESQTFDATESHQLPANQFTRDGYVFLGWALAPDGNVVYQDGEEISIDSDMTLYAVWANPTLTLTAESADWSSGSITLRCEDADTSGASHKYSLEYCDESGAWIAVGGAGAANVFVGAAGFAHLTDGGFCSRLDGIKTVSYRVKDENGRMSEPCVTRNRYGLSVGIGQYAGYDLGLDNNVGFAVDANLCRNLALSQGGFSRFREFLDSDATATPIRSEMATLAQLAKPGDTVLFFVSAHGSNGKIHLYGSTSYSTAQIQADVEAFNSGVAVIGIIMACHSGSLLQLGSWPSNAALISSCTAKQISILFGGGNVVPSPFGGILFQNGWEDGYADRSLFGTSWGGGNGDGIVTFDELARYATEFSKGYSDMVASSSVQVTNRKLLEHAIAGRAGSGASFVRPLPPASCEATHGINDAEIQVTWAQVADPTIRRYWIFRKKPGDASAACISRYAKGGSFSDARTIEKTTLPKTQGIPSSRIAPDNFVEYQYHVCSVNPCGISDPSPVATGMSGTVNLQQWYSGLGYTTSSEIALARTSMASNGNNTIEECYVTGISPNDETAKFEARIEIGADGNPVVSWSPDLNEDGAKHERVYRVLGAKSLDHGAEWDDVTDLQDYGAEQGYRFFKVDVELP